jgi:hypothetical protein
MSEGEKKKGILGEIKEIFLFLTEGEPSPDDEIDAREMMIGKFRELIEDGLIPEKKDQINKILKKLEEWDTLELWFLETSIPGDIEQLLNISSKSTIKIQEINEITPSLEKELKVQESEFDIGEIVDKVSQQFKGEIDVLKDTIENLRKEIDKKDEAIQDISHKKKVQKITPKKNVNLPPLKIKIPIIKKAPLKIEEKIEESIPPIPPEPPVKRLIQPKRISEQNKKVLTPIPSKPVELNKKEINESHLSPIPINMVEIKPKKPEITTTVIEESKDKPLISEKKKVTTVIEEEDQISTKGKSDSKAFSVEKPRISSVRIEEAETESIKSSGLDLFDVLSSVGEDIRPKGEPKSKQISEERKRERPSKPPLKEPEISRSPEKTHPISFIDFNNKAESKKVENQQTDFDDLPNDKDTLYQELIALEGKRYAIEKTFKELENSFNKGSISDMQFKSSNDEFKDKMKEITTRINTIRRLISSL